MGQKESDCVGDGVVSRVTFIRKKEGRKEGRKEREAREGRKESGGRKKEGGK